MLEGLARTPEPFRVPVFGTEPRVALSPDAGLVEHTVEPQFLIHNLSISCPSKFTILRSPEVAFSGATSAAFIEEHFLRYERQDWERAQLEPSRAVRLAMGYLMVGAAEKALTILAPMQLGADYWCKHYYGIALAKLNRPKEAESVFRALCDSRKGDYRPAHALGCLFLQEERYAEARRTLETACSAVGADALTYSDAAVAAMGEHDIRGAIALLRTALRIDEACTVALNNMGVCYQLQGHTSKAKRFFLAALHTDPNCGSSVQNTAELLIRAKDFSAAIELLGSYRERNPGDLVALERLAWAHTCLGSRDVPIKLLREGVKISGANDASLLNNLGIAQYAKGRFEEAEKVYLKAIQLDRSNLIFRSNCALLYSFWSRWKEVLSLLPSASEVLQNVDAVILRCGALVHTGEYECATRELVEARKAYPDEARLIVWLGYMLASPLDQLDEAIALLQEGHAKHPADLGIVNNYAYALVKTGRIAEARDLIQSLVSDQKVAPGAVALLRATWGLIRIREGAFEEGLRYYGLARQQSAGHLRARIEKKMLIERGRRLLECGDRKESARLLREAKKGAQDAEFDREAKELLLLCNVQGTA